MRTYDAVLFDAGETLVHPHPSFGGLLHEILSSLGHPADLADVERHAREVHAHHAGRAADEGWMWSTSNDSSRRFWTTIYTTLLENLGIEGDYQTIAAQLYEEFTRPHHYTVFPDALPALRELKSYGYRLGVISNWEDWLGTLLERVAIMPLLDVAIVSGAEGIEKPDPRIFQMALDKMGVQPERAVYVGDSPTHDIAPARALGMGAVLLDRHGQYDGLYRPTIASLGLLAAVV